ncbi:MAG: hypothetical protein KF787_13295 [Phycisphaeraceae bacterium]|nr:hypothetical protein [Phycisphaerae bacterium]MBX3393610.1 hypothetical protein [Phycisphaeraceae bacterium]HRJ50408.1 DUF6265 family protein [Phycisphaerales bacterium]
MSDATSATTHVRPVLFAGLLAVTLAAGTVGPGHYTDIHGPPGHEPAVNGVTNADESLQRLAWLRGTWVGNVNADRVEETWSAPAHDSIIGMFRWQSGGRTTLYELLSIKAEEGVPILRLRHFDSVFEPWKSELGGVASLPLAESGDARALFRNTSDVGGIASCEYSLDDGGSLNIAVNFKDPQRPALSFSLRPVRGEAPGHGQPHSPGR